jgi:hypothetical protein
MIFDDGAVILGSVIWTLSIVLTFFNHNVSRVEPTLLGPVDRASLYRWTREEPSLETLWLKNIRTMDKFQIIDPY